MSDREHAILSASGAHRWLECTPSARLELEEQTEDCSVYAAEGTAAHALAELKLSREFFKITEDEYLERYEAFKVENAQYYNAEFEEYVDNFVSFVKNEFSKVDNGHIYFETRVNFSNVVPQGFGTADVLIIGEDIIHVIDLKFGAGVPVSAIGNPQLRLYAMGALNMFPNCKTIKTTINQPRLLSCDTEELDKKTLVDWAFDYVKPRAEEAVKGEGTLHASEHACKFCKLRGKCKARADLQLENAKREFSIVDTKQNIVQNLSPERISEILEIAPMFIDWFKDVEAYALGQLMQGNKIPGYKLVEGRSNRIITNEKAVKDTLLKIGLTEKEIMKPQEMLGISGLEKLVGKKLFNDLCGEYIIKPVGKMTMAQDTDRRPEVTTLQTAQRDFAEPIA